MTLVNGEKSPLAVKLLKQSAAKMKSVKALLPNVKTLCTTISQMAQKKLPHRSGEVAENIYQLLRVELSTENRNSSLASVGTAGISQHALLVSNKARPIDVVKHEIEWIEQTVKTAEWDVNVELDGTVPQCLLTHLLILLLNLRLNLLVLLILLTILAILVFMSFIFPVTATSLPLSHSDRL
ncbi:hypothetical protein EMCRGX_G014763 [Ephydatia muelleri]